MSEEILNQKVAEILARDRICRHCDQPSVAVRVVEVPDPESKLPLVALAALCAIHAEMEDFLFGLTYGGEVPDGGF